MRMRTCKTIPQGQEAYEVQMGLFFPDAVVGEGGGYPSTFVSAFKIDFFIPVLFVKPYHKDKRHTKFKWDCFSRDAVPCTILGNLNC